MSRKKTKEEVDMSPDEAASIPVAADSEISLFAEIDVESDVLDSTDTRGEELIALLEVDEDAKPTGKALKKKKIAAEKSTAQNKSNKTSGAGTRRRNPIMALIVFLQQVIAQMKLVHWITRRQTLMYTLAVLAFVVVCVGFVALWDVGFNYLMDKIFVRAHPLPA